MYNVSQFTFLNLLCKPRLNKVGAIQQVIEGHTAEHYAPSPNKDIREFKSDIIQNFGYFLFFLNMYAIIYV